MSAPEFRHFRFGGKAEAATSDFRAISCATLTGAKSRRAERVESDERPFSAGCGASEQRRESQLWNT
eukprot:scaffold7357_cov195-Pinguiococcus_pyrenoidosus.AAC.8